MNSTLAKENFYYQKGYSNGYKDGIQKATEILAEMEQVKTTSFNLLLSEVPEEILNQLKIIAGIEND